MAPSKYRYSARLPRAGFLSIVSRAQTSILCFAPGLRSDVFLAPGPLFLGMLGGTPSPNNFD